MNKPLCRILQGLLFAGLVMMGMARPATAQSANAVSAQAGPRTRISREIDEAQRVTLRGNVHPLARAEFDRGAVAFSQPVTRMMLLLQRSPEQEAALERLLDEQQIKSSANYHKWLTPAEFGQQFGPADADIQVIKDWLASRGFTGIKISAGKTLLQFDGTSAQVAEAFHTTLRRYVIGSKDHFANASDPEIPAAISPVVAGLVSLHNFRKKPLLNRVGNFRKNMATGEVTAQFTFTDVNGTFFAIGPGDFATIYNIPAGADAAGQSIAVVGRSNINIQDVRDFRTVFGLPPNDPEIILNGPDPGLVSGDETESDLDVQWAGAVAPAAKIKFVTTQTTFTDAVDGVDASAIYIIDNNIAPILSESYGSCEASLGAGGNAFYRTLWQQAAAQGISVSIAAGDNGSAGCDDPTTASSATHGLGVSGLASTPFNVAVGGTDFDYSLGTSTYWNTTAGTINSAKSYIPELPWNDSCAASGLTGCNTVTSPSQSLNIVAGSGGPSSVYAKPIWQTGTGVPADGARDLPDISLFSGDGLNRTFYVICESDEDIAGDTGCSLTKFTTTAPFHDFVGVGGTSAAAPAFAGIMALVNQKTGQRQGNPNPTLYKLLGASGVFHDVASGNISVPCPGGAATLNCSKTTSGGFGVLVSGGNPAFQAGAGYDLATGLGTINTTNLLNSWANPLLDGTNTALSSLTPATLTVGTTVTASGSVTKTGGTGTPSGIVVLENMATGAPLDRLVLDGSGNFSGGTAFLPAGSYSVIAHYGGDTAFSPSDSSPIPVNVGKQNSTVVVSFVTFVGNNAILSTAAQNVPYGSPYVLRVDVTNSSGTPCQNSSGAVVFLCPTGSVKLFDGANALNDFPNAQTPNATNSATLNDRGFAEDQPVQLNVGAHSITATYTADVNSSYNSQNSSNALSITITQATTTTTVNSSTFSVASGGTATLTATVSSSSNSSAGPSGTVQFLNNGISLGAAVTCTPAGATNTAGASCMAKLTTAISALPPGFFAPRPGPSVPVIFVWLAGVLALLSLLAALKLSGRRRVLGYAAFALFAVMGMGLSGCGGGSSTPQTRTATITAKYSGDTNYAASTSAGVVITVQ